MTTQQFQYEEQDYQEACVNNIITIFESLEQGQSMEDVFSKHYQKNNYSFPTIGTSKNIDIMMETGTGKTFTFIKTMFELYKSFNYSKFIILIPSVAIREGTKANLEDTKEYFKALYANEKHKEIESYVYESGKSSVIDSYLRTTNLAVLILTPDSFNQDDNILNRLLQKELYLPDLFREESTPPKTYLDALKRLNPIVIMDEPHKFQGQQFKKYFQGFDNYLLRFGATFPEKSTKKNTTKKNTDIETLPLSNVAYVLDSISAFRESLVKKIVVYTQDVIEYQDTLVGIKTQNRRNIAVVQSLVNGVAIQRELTQGHAFNDKNIKRVNKRNIVLNDDTRVLVDYTLTDEALRAMIRQTIKIHLEKEKMLFKENIKALTLFFIKSDTQLFRGDNPKIKQIFEEEYADCRKHHIAKLDKEEDKAYLSYLQKDYDEEGGLRVHRGYFSGDKGNNDEKIKAGVEEILSDKKKLLSFESPTRFIFSIWALQEGWDNPNVFTICKLSNEGSEISKLQQIGRGLRISVNQELWRNTVDFLDGSQEEFWRINQLDVIVPSQEYGFVEGIQNEILKKSFLVHDTFTRSELLALLHEKGQLDEKETLNLFKLLESKSLIEFVDLKEGIEYYQKSPDYHKLLAGLDTLSEEHRPLLNNLFANDISAYIENSKNQKIKKPVIIKNEHVDTFKALWASINKNLIFFLDTLSLKHEAQLIKNITAEIETLDIQAILLQTLKHEYDLDRLDKEGAIKQKEIASSQYQRKVDYLSFVQELATKTKTPLTFVVAIFNSLSSNFKSHMLINNPKQALKEMERIIQRNLIETIQTRITYHEIKGKILPNVFKADKAQNTYLEKGSTGKFQKEIDRDFSLKSKWVFKEVIEYDSDFEVSIIEEDPDIDAIEVFAKLHKLKIKTPLGEYNPDFCYAIKNTEGQQLILVVEAKGYDTSGDIPNKEKQKINFAKLYFDFLNNYYQKTEQNINIQFKERINRTQLTSLLENLVP